MVATPNGATTRKRRPQSLIGATAPQKPLAMRREAGDPADLSETPGLLRHLQRLTDSFI